MKLRLLDLFCGAGGAGMGYARAGFDVTGVDVSLQPHYPFPFYQADALEFVLEHGHEYDAIHASPPCQGYSTLTAMEYRGNHPLMIGDTREALRSTGRPYVIENVAGARRHMIRPLMLCGTMFGLKLWRHRFFEISPRPYILTPPCNHSVEPILVSGNWRRWIEGRGYVRKDFSKAEKATALGIDWMTIREMDEAIPPAFTEFIGRHLVEQILVTHDPCGQGRRATGR